MTDDQRTIQTLLARLRAIAAIGGNLPDDRLTNKTGPNDAAHRGFMYCEARRLAKEAIELEAAANLPIGLEAQAQKQLFAMYDKRNARDWYEFVGNRQYRQGREAEIAVARALYVKAFHKDPK